MSAVPTPTGITRLGITGPRIGLSPRQLQALTQTLTRARDAGATDFHHGDCVGADELGAEVAKGLGYRLVCHPPSNPKLRAYVHSDEYRRPKGYLERDRELVDELGYTGALLGFPSPPEVTSGSGTWYTVRYARYKRTPLLCVTPDGLVIDHYRVDSIYPLTTEASVTTDLRVMNRPEGAA